MNNRKSFTWLGILGMALVLLSMWPTMVRGAASPIRLKDVTKESGIFFVHTDGSSGRYYLPETVASGLALFDFDGDGDVDIYFLNGAPLPGGASDDRGRNALYRNDGGWKFVDVTDKAGVGGTGYALGVCTGDYDNDGDEDLYVNNFGPSVLYRNNGDGTFTDVGLKAGVRVGQHVGAGACFLDMDADGDLDLFVTSYVQFTFESHHITHMNGFPSYVGPLNYPPTVNHLFRNNGDGSFTDVSLEAGLGELKSSGMGVVAGDVDNDGDTDLFVANDLRANWLLLNDGKGHFKEVGALMGVAYDSFGNVQGNMGVECVDWNHDGRLDLFVTTYQRQLTTLYQNGYGKIFDDVTRKTGLGAGSYAQVKWGLGVVDFDNDTHRDVFVACGHLIDKVEHFDDTTSYNARNLLLRNNGEGRFVNVSEDAGDGLAAKLSSRGAAFDDLDGDGDVDVVILNARREPTLLRNDTVSNHHWIQIELQGVNANRDGVGSRVEVVTGDLVQIDEVRRGRSYQSDFGHRLQFGLGQRRKVDELRVKWLGGAREVFRDVPVDGRLLLVEGRGMRNLPAGKVGGVK